MEELSKGKTLEQASAKASMHRNTGAKYRDLGKLMGHLGMTPRTTAVGKKEQNGDVEALRRAYDALAQQMGDGIKADVEYLRVLHLSAATMESEVDAAFTRLLAAGTTPTAEAVKEIVVPAKPTVPELSALPVDLESYDVLTEIECVERRTRKVERLLKQSALPADKTLGTLEEGRLPVKVRRQIPTLCEGGFVERAENVLAFGLPGRGESHLLCGIAREIVDRGYAVLFTPAYRLVQRLLAAKRDLEMVGFALCKGAVGCDLRERRHHRRA